VPIVVWRPIFYFEGFMFPAYLSEKKHPSMAPQKALVPHSFDSGRVLPLQPGSD
jgi:hypothetical protein